MAQLCPAQGFPLPVFMVTVMYIVLDPIGSSVPNILNKDIKMKVTVRNCKIALTCEGQAFPTPGFRSPFALILAKNSSFLVDFFYILSFIFRTNWKQHAKSATP